MDMRIKEIKLLSSNCWQTKYQPLTTDMSKEIYEGRYRKNLNNSFIPETNLFHNFQMTFYTPNNIDDLEKLKSIKKLKLNEKTKKQTQIFDLANKYAPITNLQKNL